MTPVLVTFIRSYDFTNDDGEKVQGFNLEYLDPDQDPKDHDREQDRGLLTFKASIMDLGVLDDFPAVPGFYNLSYSRSRDQKGRESLRVKGAELVSPANLSNWSKAALKQPQQKE